MKLYSVYVSLLGSSHCVEGTIYASSAESAIKNAKKALKRVTEFDDTMIATAEAEEIKENLKVI